MREYTHGKTKVFPQYYYKKPFVPLDDLYQNPSRTSFLLVNQNLISPKEARWLLGKKERTETFGPSPSGVAKFEYFEGRLSPIVTAGIQQTYFDNDYAKQGTILNNLRFLVGVDYQNLMYYAERKESENLVLRILERDYYFLCNLAARVVIERITSNPTRSNASIKLSEQFNKVARLPLTYTPNFTTSLANEEFMLDFIQKNIHSDAELRGSIYQAIDLFPLEKPSPDYVTNWRAYLDIHLREMNGITPPLSPDKQVSVMADFTPTARLGDLMASLPKEKRRFGVDEKYIKSSDFVDLTKYYGLNDTLNVFYMPKSALENKEGHTAYTTMPEQDACFYGYSQRAMTYRFLNTLEYLAQNHQIERETVDILTPILYTNLLGNKVNMLVDFGKLYYIVTNNSLNTLRPYLFSLIEAQKANLNWVYADHCENLQTELPKARDLIKPCLATTTRKQYDLSRYTNTLQPQFEYVFSRLYRQDRPDAIDYKIKDGGKYKYYYQKIKNDISPLNEKDFYPIEDFSKF